MTTLLIIGYIFLHIISLTICVRYDNDNIRGGASGLLASTSCVFGPFVFLGIIPICIGNFIYDKISKLSIKIEKS